MRIALFHNYYKMRGGEDEVFELECRALEACGHEVHVFTVHNDKAFSGRSPFGRAMVAFRAPYNRVSYGSVTEFLKECRPDVGHVHNWFPLLSPAIYQAHKDLGIPVVQTLHNYRMGCAAGTFRREGKTCEDCLHGSRWAAVKNKCYRGSCVGSFAWKRMVDQGWDRGRFTNLVSRYISPSLEVANKHIEMGIERGQISVIPNACEDPSDEGSVDAPPENGGAVFLGRLVKEKGADVAIEAWKKLQERSGCDVPLEIIGEGPERAALEAQAKGVDSIRFTGRLDHEAAMKKVRDAAMLVFPSRWAEPFGLGVIEAMASGRPVIASNLGAPKELINNNVNGVLVRPDDSRDLADAVESILSERDRLVRMGNAARSEYEQRFQPESHVRDLVTLYESVCQTQ